MTDAGPALAVVAVMALAAFMGGRAADKRAELRRKKLCMSLEKQAEEERKILYENPDDPPHLRRWRKSK